VSDACLKCHGCIPELCRSLDLTSVLVRSVVPRKPRIENPGGIYHVSSRGNRGCVVYHDDVERRVFLTLLSSVVRQFDWKCHAYVLMSNHFHLLVQLEAGGLSAGMQVLNGSFARFSNRRHDYIGQHLFRNRFWSDEIVTEKHLLETACYIVLNPVRARICESPADWAWSSYRALGWPRPRAELPSRNAASAALRNPTIGGQADIS
jgi:putative transposase